MLLQGLVSIICVIYLSWRASAKRTCIDKWYVQMLRSMNCLQCFQVAPYIRKCQGALVPLCQGTAWHACAMQLAPMRTCPIVISQRSSGLTCICYIYQFVWALLWAALQANHCFESPCGFQRDQGVKAVLLERVVQG